MATPGDAEASDELEAMRSVDSSWLPCTVSLSSYGGGLTIDFGSEEPGDLVLTKAEVLKHLRFRSIPLQGDDCTQIKEGEHVLAACKSQSTNCFYDATVEKVCRVRHSKRINCRCTFTIKLLQNGAGGETFTVQSTAIMRLAKRNIADHSVISAFLRSIENQCLSTVSPSFPVNEENEPEVDLSIHMANGTKPRILKDCQSGAKVDKKGQVQRRLIDEFETESLHLHVDDLSHFKASAQGPVKVQLDMEVNVPLPLCSSTFELSNNRSRLSPLAARAALASLVSATHELVPNGTKVADTTATGNVPLLNDTPPEVPSTFLAIPDATDFKSTATYSTVECKVSQPTKTGRITRSAARGGAATITCEIQITSSAEDLLREGSTNTRRITRSARLEGRENVAVKEGLKDNDVDEITKSNKSSTKRKVAQKNEPVSVPVDQNEPDLLPTESLEEKVEEKKRDKALDVQEKVKKESSVPVRNAQQTEGQPANSHGQKRKSTSSSKQERRFSPRLNHLPRTRSQNRCQV